MNIGHKFQATATNTQPTAQANNKPETNQANISNPFNTNKPLVRRIAKRSTKPDRRPNTSRQPGEHSIRRHRTTKRLRRVRRTTHAGATVRAHDSHSIGTRTNNSNNRNRSRPPSTRHRGKSRRRTSKGRNSTNNRQRSDKRRQGHNELQTATRKKGQQRRAKRSRPRASTTTSGKRGDRNQQGANPNNNTSFSFSHKDTYPQNGGTQIKYPQVPSRK